MELFDKKFVHFMWDDELEGKKCFVKDCIDELVDIVEKGGCDASQEVERGVSDAMQEVRYSGKPYSPFHILCDGEHYDFVFAYYDPNYEAKKAFNEGKKVQHLDGLWIDDDEPIWIEGLEYRIKPEEEKWIAYLARQGDEYCYLTACTKDNWEDIQKNRNVKTKLFVGSESEVGEWYQSRRKFAGVIKAWEDGKQIQIRHTPNSDWVDLNNETPKWHVCYEYRAKPEEKAVVAKRCSGCVHEHCSATKEPCVSCKPEDSKYEAKLCETCEYLGYSDDSEPCSSCSDENGYPNWKPVKKWRPYESSAEMIADFIDRFKVNCPSYCEPFVWIKGKWTDSRYLVLAFHENGVEFNDDEPLGFDLLLDSYAYLDGSPCGMEVEE